MTEDVITGGSGGSDDQMIMTKAVAMCSTLSNGGMSGGREGGGGEDSNVKSIPVDCPLRRPSGGKTECGANGKISARDFVGRCLQKTTRNGESTRQCGLLESRPRCALSRSCSLRSRRQAARHGPKTCPQQTTERLLGLRKRTSNHPIRGCLGEATWESSRLDSWILGCMDTWMSDPQSRSKNDTTTAECNENVNGQIDLESFWWGKKSVIGREWQASEGKPLAHWSMTGKQCLEGVEHGELRECAISGPMCAKIDTRRKYHGIMVD
jgi:hypothetical protein